MSKLKISQISCTTPSSGVSGVWNTIVSSVSSGVGAGVGAALGALTGPGAVLATPAGAVIGGAAGAVYGKLVKEIYKSIGQHLNDELYVTINGNKVWPSKDKYHSIKAGQVANVDYACDFNGSLIVALMDEDTGNPDDNLGQMVVTSTTTSGDYFFANPKEEDMYVVSLEITP